MSPTLSEAMNPQSHPGASFARTVLPSDLAEVPQVQDRIEQLLRARHAAEAEIFGVRLAVEEAVINAMKHGNQLLRSKKVHIDYRLLADRIEIHIRDEGDGFDPNDIPDPTNADNLERTSGRGLLLMRHYMTEVRYNDAGNALMMSKVLRNGKK